MSEVERCLAALRLEVPPAVADDVARIVRAAIAEARREGAADLAARIADLADEWTPNIGQGSGHYLNPRVVVRRLDAALRGDT